ncbi:hypothetical protein ACP70R_024501 [Stipagrostis hirtigluma subsp. patula]
MPMMVQLASEAKSLIEGPLLLLLVASRVVGFIPTAPFRTNSLSLPSPMASPSHGNQREDEDRLSALLEIMHRLDLRTKILASALSQ